MDIKTEEKNLFEQNTKAYFEGLKEDVLTKDSPLEEGAEERLLQTLEGLDAHIQACQRLKLQFGQMHDYNALKKDGFSKERIQAFYEEDLQFIEEVEARYRKNLRKRDYMFGYPANLQGYSYLIQYFRTLEGKLFLMNNCGDPYQKGNYAMDSKAIERKVIALVAENFGLKEEEFWGYVTSGGTESNYWAIREGFRNFPKGKLYFSKDTHYSVEKFVSNDRKRIYNYEVMDGNPDGSIDVEKLKAQIAKDREKGLEGVILVLNWGTTCVGATDDVRGIVQYLIDNQIPYYCHIDAALFGGIASNQTDAPVVRDLKEWNVDSISVSMHKFFGTARVNGVLLSVKERKNRKIIDYIGQEDSTLLGSRDYLPFSMYQRVKEMTKRTKADTYATQVAYFEGRLTEKEVPFTRYPRSNIFVVAKPSEALCLKYQLATFTTKEGEEKAHILIFPFQKRGIIDELVEDLASAAKSGR